MSERSRTSGRADDAPRPVRVETGIIEGCPGSLIYRCGRTQILCVAELEEGVPSWRTTGGGWLTADYSMLPYATEPRGHRPHDGRIDGRSQEIRRLIGRSLRTSLDLERMPGGTIRVDCEVLRADGGTRTAAISAATIALGHLVRAHLDDGRFPLDPRVEQVLATSVGRVGGRNLVDLDYSEDHRAEIDLNVVATPEGGLVEVQGASESRPIAPAVWHELVELGLRGIAQLSATLETDLVAIED